MRAPLSWLREYAAITDEVTGREVGDALIRAGLEVESVEPATEVTGPLVVGQVLELVEEPQKNGKVIRWCQVDVGPEHNGEDGRRGIVCGAHNFAVGDLVVVALPGTTLPGGFQIASRKTYGHISDGMICAADEIGTGTDHSGILVLQPEVDGRRLVPGTDALSVLGLDDEVLDIAVTPDMGYCLSVRGLARETAQAFGVPFTDPVGRATPAPASAGHPVRLETPGCPHFVAVSVSGIDPDRTSPAWLQNRLRMAGMRPISLAVDITNYVMLETGQPIHGYDADRLAGPIVVRQAAAGERLTTLDGTERELSSDDIVIADDSGVIGLAGVMGGVTTELGEQTRRMVIEAAWFDPALIGRTARRHKLASEASKRFERGVDPGAAYAAAHRVAQLLVELAGATLEPGETVAGQVPTVPEQTITAALADRVLGTEVGAERVVQILRGSGVEVRLDQDRLHCQPPTWRPDLRDPYDYVEEVGRKVGLDTITPVLPRPAGGRGLTRRQQLRRAVAAAVAAAGFVEVIQFPFAAEADLDRMQVPGDDPRRELVRLANPLADTAPYLRTSLLPGLFAAVTRNTSRSQDDLALYESGPVFFGPVGKAPVPSVAQRPSGAELAAMNDALPQQPRHLAAVVTGAWTAAGWQGAGEPAGWVQAIGFAQTAAEAVGVRLGRAAAQQPPWHPGRCAALSVGGAVVGYAGELHPSVCQAFGLPARTAAAELDLDAVIALAPATGEVTAVSSHPVAKEDVALIVDASVPAAEVEQALVDGAGELLEEIRLFDVYTGEQVGKGRKSLAYALRFRAPDRTLTDTEAGAARDAAIASAVERCQAVPRTG